MVGCVVKAIAGLGVALLILILFGKLLELFGSESVDDEGASYANAQKIAAALNEVGLKTCRAFLESPLQPPPHLEAAFKPKTIMCAVNTTDRELDKLTVGLVTEVNEYDLHLSGWQLVLMNHNDYVVTRRF